MGYHRILLNGKIEEFKDLQYSNCEYLQLIGSLSLKNVEKYRPKSYKNSHIRTGKDTAYWGWRNLHIYPYIKNKGVYVGLAGDYGPEIYKFFSLRTNTFISCENQPSRYEAQLNYLEKYKYLYPDTSFSLVPKDILDYLIKDNKQEVQILDLDLMRGLYVEDFDKLALAIESCAANVISVALWSCLGRSRRNTLDQAREHRDELGNFINARGFLRLLKYSSVEYRDSKIPMGVGMYTFEKVNT